MMKIDETCACCLHRDSVFNGVSASSGLSKRSKRSHRVVDSIIWISNRCQFRQENALDMMDMFGYG